MAQHVADLADANAVIDEIEAMFPAVFRPH